MSAFAIFVLVLTVIYVIYYSAIIMQDLYAKKDAPKTEEEDFDVSQMQNQEEPISITEDANGFHLNGDTTEEQEEPSSVTWIENDDDANKYQEKIKKEHTSVEEECQRLQDSMEDVDVDSTGETEADVMVNMLLNQKPGGPKIFYSRDNVLKHLEVYCDEATTFDDIDAEWIQGFKDYLNTAEKDAQKKTDPKVSYVFVGLSQNSKVSYFNKLRACLNQAFEEHIIDKNPIRGVEGFKQEEVAREYLTLDEVKKMAATPCNYPILKATFLFSCLTGLRKSDIEKLTWGEVQKFGKYTRIVFKQKKTGGQEYLDISDQAAAYLGTRRNDVDRVFEGFTYGAWTSLELKRWALAAGISKNLTFHCARHTFAVMMLDLGADIYTVSKLLGHRELSTTQIYAKVLDKNKQAAVNLIPDISK